MGLPAREVQQNRHIFLTAAKDLREGVVPDRQDTTASQDTILAMPIHLLVDFVGVHIISNKTTNVGVRVNLTFQDSGWKWNLWVRNGVHNAREGHVDDDS